MLEHVAANQTRFVVPGLSADPRGVALGRWAVVLLPTLDRLVSFFRGLSARTSLDDMRHGMRIAQVKTPLQSREFIVQLPVQSSFVADGVAGVAGLCRGLTFTGSAKHFVKYRDNRSPLGYDVSGLHGGGGDYIVYADDFVQPYEVVREIDLRQLVLGLALVPQRDQRLLPDEEVLLRVVPGLWRAVVGYLRRNNVACRVAVSQLGGETAGAPPEVTYLVRTHLPERMATLFCSTPGIELLRLVAERAAVEAGFAHPVELGSCNWLFAEGQFCLFSGSREQVDQLDGEPVFVDGSALVTLPRHRPPEQRRPTVTEPNQTVQIPLRLVATPERRPEARAVRIVRQRAGWLQRLVYLLPARLIEGIRICTTEQDIFLTSDGPLELVPLGQPYYAAAPGVLVPLGWELLPRVAPQVLLSHLSSDEAAGPGNTFFFEPGQADPLIVPQSAFVPMDRSVLARVAVSSVNTDTPPRAPDTEPTLVNAPAGVFPLWGFTDESAGD